MRAIKTKGCIFERQPVLQLVMVGRILSMINRSVSNHDLDFLETGNQVLSCIDIDGMIFCRIVQRF